MHKKGFYSSGEFAKKAHITKKTLRYYDEHNILRPSALTDSGARLYTDNDFAKLQQILFLKYLSFSLADIKEMTVRNEDKDFWQESLTMQSGLVEERIEQLTIMKKALDEARVLVKSGKPVDWGQLMDVVNLNEMEEKLKLQYLNSSNLSARINLHRDYSVNKEGWFPWVFRQCCFQPGERVLELGCGDGSLWAEGLPMGTVLLGNSTSSIQREREIAGVAEAKFGCSEANLDRLLGGLDGDIILTDISEGIVKEAERRLQNIIGTLQQSGENKTGIQLTARTMDAHSIDLPDSSCDIVIANHVLFYCQDIPRVLSEIRRVLKPTGRLICSTYSRLHMQEITKLAKGFDDRIVLSGDCLYERFGKENGAALLRKYFTNVEWHQYEDELIIDKAEPIIAYIMSCHGNQNRYIVDHYQEFAAYVKRRLACSRGGFHVTKDAGIFVAHN